MPCLVADIHALRNMLPSFPFQHLELCHPSVLSEELLLHAYCSSFFPMAEIGGMIRWHSPDPRAIFPLSSLKVSRSVRKSVEKSGFVQTIDQAFADVIEACSRRDLEDEVWISDDIIDIYSQLHDQGVVHSVETWSEGELVGGLYGVSIGAAFFGESMFSTKSNASKAAFAFLINWLQAKGYQLLDTQYLNHFTQQLGAIELPRETYLSLLQEAISEPREFRSPSE